MRIKIKRIKLQTLIKKENMEKIGQEEQMIHCNIFKKYWRLPELQGLSLVAAVEKMLEMEGVNGNY